MMRGLKMSKRKKNKQEMVADTQAEDVTTTATEGSIDTTATTTITAVTTASTTKAQTTSAKTASDEDAPKPWGVVAVAVGGILLLGGATLLGLWLWRKKKNSLS